MTEKNIKTYLIIHDNGTEQQVDIPADWKVTFGPASRGSNGDGTKYKIPLALRFYEHDDRQRAIFTDVVSFRDMSIPIRVKKESTQEKLGHVECGGVRKTATFTVKQYEWVNPDEEIDQQKLPSPSQVKDFDVGGFDFKEAVEDLPSIDKRSKAKAK